MSKRYEKERGSWVLAHAGRRAGARRRGEKLMMAARRADRYAAGAGDALAHEVTTRNVFHRWIFREDGAANTAGWLALTVIMTIALSLGIGPAFVISRVAYAAWWVMVPKWGRMIGTPYLGLSAAISALGYFTLTRTETGAASGFFGIYVLSQVVLGLAWAAALVWSSGWLAVGRQEKQTGMAKPHTFVIDLPSDTPSTDDASSPNDPSNDNQEASPAEFEIVVDLPAENGPESR